MNIDEALYSYVYSFINCLLINCSLFPALIAYFCNLKHTLAKSHVKKRWCDMVCAIFKTNILVLICTISVFYQQQESSQWHFVSLLNTQQSILIQLCECLSWLSPQLSLLWVQFASGGFSGLAFCSQLVTCERNHAYRKMGTCIMMHDNNITAS